MQDLAGKFAFVADRAAMARAADANGAERTERINRLLANALDPEVVGDMVVHAIQTDEFYIFTHPEIQQFTDARAAEMAQSFGRWSAYRQQHGVSK